MQIILILFVVAVISALICAADQRRRAIQRDDSWADFDAAVQRALAQMRKARRA